MIDEASAERGCEAESFAAPLWGEAAARGTPPASDELLAAVVREPCDGADRDRGMAGEPPAADAPDPCFLADRAPIPESK